MVTDYGGKFEFDQGVEKLFSLQNGRRYRLKTNEAFFLDKLCKFECKNFKIIFFLQIQVYFPAIQCKCILKLKARWTYIWLWKRHKRARKTETSKLNM